MGEPYKQCFECGKRALSIATRCPGCGFEFQAPLIIPGGGEPGRILTPGRVAAAVAVVAVLVSARLGGTSQLAEEQSASISYAASPAAMTGPFDTASVNAPPADPAEALLVARDWTHVRKSRSKSAGLEAMLMPGDTVLADSLGKGWYRVALEGEVLGYAHRSTLAALSGGP